MMGQTKAAIFGAIVGALLSGILSLGVGFFTLYRSFEITIQKELVNQLRTDITLLKVVNEAMEENIALLFNGNMVPEINEVKFQLPIDSMNKELDDVKSKDFEAIKNLIRVFVNMQGVSELYRLEKVYIPKTLFRAMGWYPSYSTEISFELSRDISDLYQKMNRINSSISEVRMTIISNSRILNAANLDTIKEIINDIKKDVEYLSQAKIIELNKRIINEINQLEQNREALINIINMLEKRLKKRGQTRFFCRLLPRWMICRDWPGMT